MSYENDVFISYAHEENVPVPPETHGWVDVFEETLRAYLGRTAGDPPRIWRDPSLKRTGDLDERILDQLTNSAVLLCILSKSYVRSTYCLGELKNFVEKFGDKRVFKVVTATLPAETEHPAPLNKHLGYPFYELEESTRDAYDLDLTSDQSRRLYRRLAYSLARDIADRLMELGAGTETSPRTGTVFLAHTSFDLFEKGLALRNELERNGFEVLPDQPLPPTHEQCETSVKKWLERCCLSIHLLGRYHGGVPDGPGEESFVALQNRLALERAAASGGRFFRLLWLPPRQKVDDREQIRLIENLRQASTTYQNADLLERPFEEFKATALAKAKQGIESLRTNTIIRPGSHQIYLLYAKEDEGTVDSIDSALTHSGYEVRLPVFEGDEPSRLQDQQNALVASRQVVLYWGMGSEAWLNSQVSEIRKAQGYGRTEALSYRVAIGGPDSPRKQRALRNRVAKLAKDVVDDLVREVGVSDNGDSASAGDR